MPAILGFLFFSNIIFGLFVFASGKVDFLDSVFEKTPIYDIVTTKKEALEGRFDFDKKNESKKAESLVEENIAKELGRDTKENIKNLDLGNKELDKKEKINSRTYDDFNFELKDELNNKKEDDDKNDP